MSISEHAYTSAERLSRLIGKSRNRLFAEALQEYLANHAPDQVTKAMNRACADIAKPSNDFVTAAAHHVLERCEW